MDDVRGRFLGLPHGTTQAAVTNNKNIRMSSFKSSENIQKKKGGPDRSVSDNQPKIEFIWAEITLSKSKPFLICSAYRPPNATAS